MHFQNWTNNITDSVIASKRKQIVKEQKSKLMSHRHSLQACVTMKKTCTDLMGSCSHTTWHKETMSVEAKEEALS